MLTFFRGVEAVVAEVDSAEDVLERPRTIEAALRSGLPIIVNKTLGQIKYGQRQI
jgi:hypothetical protein